MLAKPNYADTCTTHGTCVLGRYFASVTSDLEAVTWKLTLLNVIRVIFDTYSLEMLLGQHVVKIRIFANNINSGMVVQW